MEHHLQTLLQMVWQWSDLLDSKLARHRLSFRRQESDTLEHHEQTAAEDTDRLNGQTKHAEILNSYLGWFIISSMALSSEYLPKVKK